MTPPQSQSPPPPNCPSPPQLPCAKQTGHCVPFTANVFAAATKAVFIAGPGPHTVPAFGTFRVLQRESARAQEGREEESGGYILN